MNHIQQVDFYLHQLPEKAGKIATVLRSFIHELVPEAEEKFSFKLPFYHYYGMFCYINLLKKQEDIELCFCRGKDLIMAFPELECKNRTMVAGYTITDLASLDSTLVRSIIIGAATWQQSAHHAGLGFVKPGKKDLAQFRVKGHLSYVTKPQ